MDRMEGMDGRGADGRGVDGRGADGRGTREADDRGADGAYSGAPPLPPSSRGDYWVRTDRVGAGGGVTGYERRRGRSRGPPGQSSPRDADRFSYLVTNTLDDVESRGESFVRAVARALGLDRERLRRAATSTTGRAAASTLRGVASTVVGGAVALGRWAGGRRIRSDHVLLICVAVSLVTQRGLGGFFSTLVGVRVLRGVVLEGGGGGPGGGGGRGGGDVKGGGEWEAGGWREG